MKKNLLVLAGALAMVAPSMSAAAVVDDFAYEVKDGVKFQNLWLYARNYGNFTADNLPFLEDWDRTRTATVRDGKIYLGYSHKIEQNGELNSGSAHYCVVDLLTGKFEKTVQVTVDGATVDALLAANQIGTDDYGNVWFASFYSSLWTESGARQIDVFVINNLETGEASKAFTVSLPDDESDAGGARVDYYDLVGDVTGKEAGTVFMCASCENSDKPYVYGWRRDQGSTKWEPHMSDGGYYSLSIDETYPADQTLFNYGSMLTIVRDEEHTGELFYIDGYTTYPALYNTQGTMLESFASAPDVQPDDVGCNGITEFSISGKDYICYPINQYNKGQGWELRVSRLGQDMSFEGMTECWTFPAKGQGTLSDSGMRIHSIKAVPTTDASGNEGAYIMQYKCNGGLGVYLVADENYGAGVSDVFVDAADADAPQQLFNLNGVAVDRANAAPGLYISRQGKTVSKVVIK